MSQRRSRKHRQSGKKHLELTARDLNVFRTLERYRYLNSEFLHALVGGRSQRRFKERLGDLFHEGYLDRPQRQWDYADCRHKPAVYEIGKAGKRALQERYSGFVERVTFLTAAAHRQFHHSVLVCHILAGFELGVRGHRTVQFIGWEEILAKSPETTQRNAVPFRIPLSLPHSKSGGEFETSIVPDAIFGLRYGEGGTGKYRFFALEVDRATMPVARSNVRGSSYRQKLMAYQKVFADGLVKSFWGLPNLMVLTVSTNDTHLNHLRTAAREISVQPSPFVFKSLAAAVSDDPTTAANALTIPWQSVDAANFDIMSA